MQVSATSVPAAGVHANAKRLSVDTALQIAWWTWFGLSALPFVLFLATIWNITLFEHEITAANEALAQKWFIGTMIYMAIGVPAAFFWRSRMFKGYWEGKLVPPRNYLLGMITIWAALELGGILALLGCLLSSTLIPNLLPALLAFMLFTPLWPNGHSMTKPLVNERDPGGYEEPR